jgi:hypothetical protein
MTARLLSIVWRQARSYELSFEIDGQLRTCTCCVIEVRGIPLVQMEPNFLDELGGRPRLVAAMVVAVDRFNQPNESPGSSEADDDRDAP